jgi:hypothetical protein
MTACPWTPTERLRQNYETTEAFEELRKAGEGIVPATNGFSRRFTIRESNLSSSTALPRFFTVPPTETRGKTISTSFARSSSHRGAPHRARLPIAASHLVKPNLRFARLESLIPKVK